MIISVNLIVWPSDCGRFRSRNFVVKISNMAAMSNQPNKPSKRNLSTSSTESSSKPILTKRQRQRSKQSNGSFVENIAEQEFDDSDSYSSADDSTDVIEGTRTPAAESEVVKPTKSPVCVDWAEMLEAMAVAFQDPHCSFTKGLSQVIDQSEKISNINERLDHIETKVAMTDQTIHEMDSEISKLKK